MAPGFDRALKVFSERVNGLDELATAVIPYLNELREQPPPGALKVRASLDAMPSEKRATAIRIINDLPGLWSAMLENNEDEVQSIVESINGQTADFSVDFEDGTLAFRTPDRELSKPIMDVADGFRKEFSTTPHAVLLRRSILTLLVGAFEVLIGELLRHHLRMYRKALNSSDKEFSLAELLEYGSIDEAVEALIASRVESFTRGGMEDWAKWFGGDILKISMAEAAGDWLKTKEIFERRNVVVHHDCRVSQQYLNKVPEKFRAGVMKGDHLDVDEQYLSDAIESVLQLGLSLGLRVWSKLAKDMEAPADWIIDTQLDYLDRGRAAVALHLGQIFDASKLPSSTGLPIQINSWLSQKELVGLDSIRDEVENWDVGSLTLLFRVAKNAILDKHEEAATGVRKLIEREELHVIDLRYWPLFAGLRKSGLVDDLLLAGLELEDHTRPLVEEVWPMNSLVDEAVATEGGGDVATATPATEEDSES